MNETVTSRAGGAFELLPPPPQSPAEARPSRAIPAYAPQTSRLRLLAINDLLYPKGYTENSWNCYMLLRQLLEHETRLQTQSLRGSAKQLPSRPQP